MLRGNRTTPSTVASGSAYTSSATRTMSAWLIARVNGRRIVKREPVPGVDSMNKSAAELLDLGRHHVHAHAAARRLRDAARGAESRLEDELHRLLVGELRVAVGETECHGLLADQLDVDAGAVVGHHDHDLGAIARQADRDAAHVRFAERRAALGRLDAVHDGVAQHVLERRHHALEHLTIELGGGPLHDELRPLAGVVRRLTHQPGEPLHVPLERHHARAHQAVLQLGDGASLLGQEILRLARQRLQQSLDARDVARGLGERARVLLDRGIAVELERVEVVAARILLVLMAVEHLRLGLDLESAQLLLETGHGARELRQIEVDGIDLLIEARAEDAHLAGIVQHRVEQVRIHASHLDALRRHALASRQHGSGAHLELRERVLGHRRRRFLGARRGSGRRGAAAGARAALARRGRGHRSRGRAQSRAAPAVRGRGLRCAAASAGAATVGVAGVGSRRAARDAAAQVADLFEQACAEAGNTPVLTRSRMRASSSRLACITACA